MKAAILIIALSALTCQEDQEIEKFKIASKIKC